jgi:membrane-associated phospholipid phosphatase
VQSGRVVVTAADIPGENNVGPVFHDDRLFAEDEILYPGQPLFVVAAIFISACVAAYEAIVRIINPEAPDHLLALALAGVIGFLGNLAAAFIRTRAGKRLDSPALVADGNHARADAYVSLGVVLSAVVVALGFDLGDPLIALVITVMLVIAAKAYTGRGTPLRGGLPSGHAAVAFGGWVAVTTLLGHQRYWFLISTVTFIMALLVAQTRVESGVHSASEVASGALLGALVTLLLFQAFG